MKNVKIVTRDNLIQNKNSKEVIKLPDITTGNCEQDRNLSIIENNMNSEVLKDA